MPSPPLELVLYLVVCVYWFIIAYSCLFVQNPPLELLGPCVLWLRRLSQPFIREAQRCLDCRECIASAPVGGRYCCGKMQALPSTRLLDLLPLVGALVAREVAVA